MIPPKEITDALWHSGRLRYKLHASQLRIYNDLRNMDPKIRERLLFISRRWGKSFLALLMALEDAILHESLVLYLGPSEKQTRRIATPLLAKITADAPEGMTDQVKSEQVWKVGKGTVMIGGFDTALESFRGLDVKSIYFEEAGLASPDVEQFQYMIYSVLMPTLMIQRGILTYIGTPSPKVHHPLHTLIIPKAKKNNAFYKYTIHDNPQLTAEEIAEEIELMGGPDSVGVQRELFCEIVSDDFTSLVPGFLETKFVQPVDPKKAKVCVLSGDVGGVRDMSVFHLLGDLEGKIAFIDERAFPANTPTETMVNSVKEMIKGHKISHYVDTPGQMSVDLGVKYGLPVTLPTKRAFDTNIADLRRPFNSGNVVIDPKCSLLIQTLNYGEFNKQKNDFGRSKHLGHMDAAASAIYGIRHWRPVGNPPVWYSKETHFDGRPRDAKTQNVFTKLLVR